MKGREGKGGPRELDRDFSIALWGTTSIKLIQKYSDSIYRRESELSCETLGLFYIFKGRREEGKIKTTI